MISLVVMHSVFITNLLRLYLNFDSKMYCIGSFKYDLLIIRHGRIFWTRCGPICVQLQYRVSFRKPFLNFLQYVPLSRVSVRQRFSNTVANYFMLTGRNRCLDSTLNRPHN